MPQHLIDLEQRLERGDQLAKSAKGAELAKLNAFWKNLLKQYEKAYVEWRVSSQ